MRRSPVTSSRQLAERVHLRYVPHLSFLFDDTLIQAAHMDQIFRELEEKQEHTEHTE
jgi:ribosome-binding factor A